jgi:hypothetical protein
MNRVTRLGEFSPSGELSTLCSFMKIAESIPNFWATFSTVKICINFDKIWAGLPFGRFFHKLIWSHSDF